MKRIHGAPLQRIVLKDRVSELIKEAILSGKLESGDRIVEMKLANDLGVGTTAVREALFELEAQGFVTRVTNKGTFVTQLSAEDVAQILRVRHELEGLAVEILERCATAADLETLQKLIDEMRAAANAGNFQGFYRVDLEFHRTLWNLTGNRFLAKALDITVVPLFAFFILKNPRDSAEDLIASADRHAQVLQALRDGGGARPCMEAALQFFAEQEYRLLFDHAGRQLTPKS
ncbi:MAG TPA: GntR family transcriptional regulator [Bryobacteraceae bacterium]|nr:GntR family transcriptional regulator [Bryobacteraceae bacterium]